MKILHFPEAHDGCTWYRQTTVLRALKNLPEVETYEIKASVSDQELEQEVKSADVLFLRASNSGLAAVMAQARAMNPALAIVADTDDDLTDISPLNTAFTTMGQYEVNFPNGKPMHQHGLRDFDLRKNWHRLVDYRWHLREADVVTTTTPRLREKLVAHNDLVAVVPNAILPADFPVLPLQTPKGITRLLWAGGSSHFEDLRMIVPDLKALLDHNPGLELHLAGQYFAAIMRELPESRVFFHPWVHPSGHGFHLATIGADIAIAPLQESPFNESKSCVKFYEYAALGWATVASNVAPYADEIRHGDTGVLADPEQFGSSIQDLIDDPLKRATIAAKGREWVTNNRDISKVVDDWVGVFTAAAKSRKEEYGAQTQPRLLEEAAAGVR